MAEIGECSASNSSMENWAKLIPTDKMYADIEINSDETVIFSETKSTSVEKHEWCKITRNSDLNTATLQNRSSNAIIVDETLVQKDETTFIKCGSEIVSGPVRDVDSNGCFSEWLKRSQEKHTNVLCPQCRAVVQFVGRNHYLLNIAEDILQADSSLRRSVEEIATLDSCSLIQSNLVIGSVKKRNQKRPHFLLGLEESGGLELPCPQCGTEYAGFRCNPHMVHLQCHECGGMMPSRFDTGIPQHCLGCDRAFCGAYWEAQSLQRSDIYATCSPETFKPISRRTISRIPQLTHENNRHEQDITGRCISQMGKTLQDVISEWIVRFSNREIDRTRMPLNHAEMITAETPICHECYEKLVGFLLYWFRISTPKYLLPEDATERENCWYGYACRTQHHNEDHARKRNHVCRPTRSR
ncbi:E3 ubiquitin-protein ligase CHFR isoform X3 [Cucumis sativus]|uniref:E3 ubiquitin-protein ligase CHFR isoform X3 n=1 Tax=Cucumis sativus TaxID=3659 RepID=UPI0012F4B832|nr:E3 ubiquitin-protein ligase CHFR isoform X3 [Cucumis sativus]